MCDLEDEKKNSRPKSMILESTRAHLTKTIDNTKFKASYAAAKSTHLAVSFVSTFLTAVLLFTVAVFLYLTFYFAYMPIDLYKIPISLKFDTCEHSAAPAEKCSSVWGEFSLERGQELTHGQSYSMSVYLTLPDNPVNEDHGMFMTCLTLKNNRGQLRNQSCKSSMIEYRSSLLRFLETIVFSPAFLFGFMSQKQYLKIDFFNDYQSDPYARGEVITLEIQSKVLQVFDAELEITADLQGLRYLMYRHPVISAIIGIFSNISFLLMVVLVSWSKFLSGDDDLEEENEVGEDDEDNMNDSCCSEDINRSTGTIQNSVDESGNLAFSGVDDIIYTPRQTARDNFGTASITWILKLLLMTMFSFMIYTSYQDQVYEPTNLIQKSWLKFDYFMTNDLKSDFYLCFRNYLFDLYLMVTAWEDIFVKLLVVKVVFVLMLMLIMTSTRFIN